MKYLFRVDSSFNIGSGHMMRCINLAKKLKGEIHFFCNNLPKNINFLVSENQFTLHTQDSKDLKLQENIKAENEFLDILKRLKPDSVIIDHYGINKDYETEVLKYCSKILVIDDLERTHHKDVAILDQNYKEAYSYNSNIQFLGPKYSILSQNFTPKLIKHELTELKEIIVYMGASDIGSITKLIYLQENQMSDLNFSYLIGNNSKDLDYFKSLQSEKIFFNIKDMPSFLNDFDLFIGAGGTTSWERAYIGMPSICIALTDNQVPTGENLKTKGVHEYLGKLGDFEIEKLEHSIENLKSNPERLNDLRKKSLDLEVASKMKDVLSFLNN